MCPYWFLIYNLRWIIIGSDRSQRKATVVFCSYSVQTCLELSIFISRRYIKQQTTQCESLLTYLSCFFLFLLKSNDIRITNQRSNQGHYIVLVGFNSKSKQVLYRNPSVKDKVCYMSFDCLEESRTSYGTDEDILFIFPQ